MIISTDCPGAAPSRTRRTARFATAAALAAGSVAAVFAAAAPAQAVHPVCSQTITGAHGDVVVPSGRTCLDGAQVTGTVSVARGASVFVEDSTVSSSIALARGSSFYMIDSAVGGTIAADSVVDFTMCGSASGPVSITRAAEAVVMGDGDPGGCLPNSVYGNVTVRDSGAAVTIVGNEITGAVVTSGLTGSVTINGNHH